MMAITNTAGTFEVGYITRSQSHRLSETVPSGYVHDLKMSGYK